MRLIKRTLRARFVTTIQECILSMCLNTRDSIEANQQELAALQAKIKQEERALAQAEENTIAELSARLVALKEKARYTHFEDPGESERLKAEIVDVASLHDSKVKAQLKTKMKAKQDEKQAEKLRAKEEAKMAKRREIAEKKRVADMAKDMHDRQEARRRQAGLCLLRRIRRRLEGDPRVYAFAAVAANWRVDRGQHPEYS